MKLLRLWKANKEYKKAMEKRHYHQLQIISRGSEMTEEELDMRLRAIGKWNDKLMKAKEELLK